MSDSVILSSGGSTIVLLFEKNVVEWDEDLLINGRASLETLVRVGMGIGRRCTTRVAPKARRQASTNSNSGSSGGSRSNPPSASPLGDASKSLAPA